VRENTYEYIIAGGGMAGLSLAFYLNESSLKDKKILVIDRAAKDRNDHTWCFWEKEENAFEEIVFRRWDKFRFCGTRGFEELLAIGDYRYKMIRAIDFYEFVIPKLSENPSNEFLQAEILEVSDESVRTDAGEFFAGEYIFDSFTRKTYDNPQYINLRQHFLGWTVATEREVFAPDEPTLFDFRVEQKDECRFFYILPFSPTKALVEFTVFSEKTLAREEYEENLREYIEETLRAGKYDITETESGVIPMSDEPHEEFAGSKIVRIGTSGGYVKPSTGYSFRRTQDRLRRLVERLEMGRRGERETGRRISKWKRFLDSVLLDVLKNKRHPADDVFTSLFMKNEAADVLRFLDEETSFREDLRIMRTVPVRAFSKAAVSVFNAKARRRKGRKDF
jgi:lycopene beta-cyclase